MQNKIISSITTEVEKAVKGKETVIRTVLMAILAGGHILLEDIPGVGKTTLSLAFSRAIGLEFAEFADDGQGLKYPHNYEHISIDPAKGRHDIQIVTVS